MRRFLAALISASALAASPLAFADAEHAPGGSIGTVAGADSKILATQAALRDLWVGHIFWVREVVRGIADANGALAKQFPDKF